MFCYKHIYQCFKNLARELRYFKAVCEITTVTLIRLWRLWGNGKWLTELNNWQGQGWETSDCWNSCPTITVLVNNGLLCQQWVKRFTMKKLVLIYWLIPTYTYITITIFFFTFLFTQFFFLLFACVKPLDIRSFPNVTN